MILIWNLKGCLDFQFPSSITQNWWVPQLSSVFGCILVFISITQFFDFWVMSYRNWKHILSVFSFHNSVSNGILVIKLTYMGPTINEKVKSHTRHTFFFFFIFLSFFLLHRLIPMAIFFFFFILFSFFSSSHKHMGNFITNKK